MIQTELKKDGRTRSKEIVNQVHIYSYTSPCKKLNTRHNNQSFMIKTTLRKTVGGALSSHSSPRKEQTTRYDDQPFMIQTTLRETAGRAHRNQLIKYTCLSSHSSARKEQTTCATTSTRGARYSTQGSSREGLFTSPSP